VATGRRTPTRGKPRLIRNSERQTYKRCRQQWYWMFVDLLKPKETGRALRFGDLIHQSLAAYYKPGIKRGPHPAKVFARLYEAQWDELGQLNMRPDNEDRWVDAGDLGESMLKAYVDKYGEHDKQFKILSSEQVFQVPLRSSGLPFSIVGTLDGVWQDRASKDIFFKEFKTAASIDPSPLAMDEQAGTYWTYAPRWMWMRGMLPKSTYPSHILYTFLRKAMQDARPVNEFGQRLNQNGAISKNQPAKYFDRFPIYRDAADRATQHQRVLDEAREMEMARNGDIAILKNPGPLYMPNCRGCPFKDMCELHETGNDWEQMRDATMVKWDPYTAHEIVERW
jgi:hypothetical protein